MARFIGQFKGTGAAAICNPSSLLQIFRHEPLSAIISGEFKVKLESAVGVIDYLVGDNYLLSSCLSPIVQV